MPRPRSHNEIHPHEYMDAFVRTLSLDHLQILSTCTRCGRLLSGSVSDGLPRREVDHFLSCATQLKTNAATSSKAA
jgi:hypothetical protein